MSTGAVTEQILISGSDGKGAYAKVTGHLAMCWATASAPRRRSPASCVCPDGQVRWLDLSAGGGAAIPVRQGQQGQLRLPLVI
jgi:hypothetical protein